MAKQESIDWQNDVYDVQATPAPDSEPVFDQATADYVRRAYERDPFSVDPKLVHKYGIVVTPVETPDIGVYES